MAALFQIQPPEKFDFRNPGKWETWYSRFKRFRTSSKLCEEEDEYQISTLIYSMGQESEDILSSFNLSDRDSKTYNKVVEKFQGFFIVKRNVIFERAKFNSRKQEIGEPVDSFITSLYALAEHCQYQALKEEMIRDRLVVGLKDEKLSLKLQLDPKLTLETATTQARQSESVQKQQDALRSGFASGQVEMVKQKRGQRKPYKHAPQKKQQNPSKSQCHRCGDTSHSKKKCPAIETKCSICHKKGHWAKVCHNARAHEIRDSPNDEEFLGSVVSEPVNSMINNITGDAGKPWFVDIQVSGCPVQFKIDCGADVTLLPLSEFKKIASQVPLQAPDRKLTGVGEYKMKVRGQFEANLKWEDRQTKQKVFVVENSEVHVPLLGRPAIEALCLIVKDARLDAVSSGEKNDYKKSYPKLFTGLGNTKQEYNIELKPNAKPFALSTPRRIALPLMEQVKEELTRMENLGVISPISKPTEWCAGMVVIPKSNNKVRICVDLTKLNENVRRENHPLPSIDETLGQLAGAKFFTKLDANSGFYQVPLTQRSAHLTTFITPFGRYCFNRLPFGISSAPEVFKRQMTQILDGIQGVPCQMDDILISGRTIEEHNHRLQAVLEKVQAAGVTLNFDKCEFAQTQIKFLGFIIDESGIRADPEKVKAISDMPEPSSITEVRRFFGMVNFLGKFSPNLAEKSKPIRDLLRADSAWCWDKPQQEAFKQIKEEISSKKVLAHYDATKATKVSADASSYGLGAVLLQLHDKDWRPVAYASRSLTPTEQRYAQVEKEALATTWACEKFSTYLIGLDFIVETDHKPLVALLGSKDLDLLPPRVQRFRMRLMRYCYTVNYVPGKTLVVADTLSRAPLKSTIAKSELSQEADAYVKQVIQMTPASEKRLDELRSKLQQDEVCKELITLCQQEWPDKRKLPGAVKPFYAFRHELTVENGLLLRGNRLIIPMSMRLEMLDQLHKGHQGIVKCRERAKQSVWWPGLSQQLQVLVQNCKERKELFVPNLSCRQIYQIAHGRRLRRTSSTCKTQNIF